jgi:hypothetical protein
LKINKTPQSVIHDKTENIANCTISVKTKENDDTLLQSHAFMPAVRSAHG